MPKSPEGMTHAERLVRIRSLERRVLDLQHALNLAEHDQASTERWAQEAWAEVRRLHDVCSIHWTEKQAIRQAAGLDPQPSLIPLAKFNHVTREWEPIDPAPAGRDGEG